MKKDKNEILSNVLPDYSKTILELASAKLKFFIPFIDIRSRIKQNRAQKFIEMLTEYFSNKNLDEITTDGLSKEYFSDLFESVIIYVRKCANEKKLERFKDVIRNKAFINYKTKFYETFLEILSKINEKQLGILITHNKNKNLNGDQLEAIDALPGGLQKKLADFRKANYYQISERDYLFYIQDLVSKGLLCDIGIGQFLDTEPLEVLEIKDFGLSFLKFIQYPKE